MLNIKGVFAISTLIFSQSLDSSHYREAKNCFPETDKRIPVFAEGVRAEDRTGITEEEFNTVLDEVEYVYASEFEKLGKTFVVNRYWENSAINASAVQRGNRWIINMYGGLARHELTTVDAFRAVACHEIGHHLGGAPKMSGWGSWASAEAQSDYFATYKCLKKIIHEGQKDGLEVLAADLSVYEEQEAVLSEEACGQRFSLENPPLEPGEEPPSVIQDTPYQSCVRSALAGLSLGRILESLRGEPKVISYLTPDTLVVSKTNTSYPATNQCRADTYLSGSLCNLDFNSELSNTDPDQGVCSRAVGFDYGTRPRCWFKPSVADDGDGEDENTQG